MKLGKKLAQHSVEEQENDELWAISYGDMITLLLSFFVIFFSTDFKKDQSDKLDEHLISSFKVFDIENKKVMNPAVTPLDTGKKLDEAPKFELLKNAKITKLNDRLLVTFDKMMFFDTAQIEPTTDGQATLNAFAKKFVPYAGLYKISIKAFTDQRPVKGGHRYIDNMELSALRALAALRVLQKAGIPLDKLELAGYGEMNKLHALLTPEKMKELSGTELQDISRTVILIIKHDNEQSVL
jgi:flagellar motor protein MotB